MYLLFLAHHNGSENDLIARYMTDKCLFHGLARNGFHQIPVKSGFTVKLYIFASRICGEGYHRSGAVQSAHLASHLFQTFYAVDPRHQMIHEYGVIVNLQALFKGFRSACCHIDTHIGILKESSFDLEIHLIVIHYEYPDLRCQEATLIGAPSDHMLAVEIELSDLLSVGYPLPDHHRKGGSAAVNTVDGYGSVHQVYELLYDGESKARSLYMPVPALVNALKGVKQERQILFLYADSGIRDGYPQLNCLVIYILALYMELNMALLRILYGVVQKVDQDLLYADLIAVEHPGNFGIYANLKAESLVVCPQPDHVNDLDQHVLDPVVNGNYVHAARFHL